MENEPKFDSKNAEEVQGLPPGETAEGVIIQRNDGKTKDFVENTTNWKGDVDQPAIEIVVETKYKETTYQVRKLFNYRWEDNKSKYTSNSNLGKYKKYYKKLPQVGDKVKLLTSADGFWKILIE